MLCYYTCICRLNRVGRGTNFSLPFTLLSNHDSSPMTVRSLHFYFRYELIYVNTPILLLDIAPLLASHYFPCLTNRLVKSYRLFDWDYTDVIKHCNSMFNLLHSINGTGTEKYVHPFLITSFFHNSQPHLHAYLLNRPVSVLVIHTQVK